MKRLIQRSTLLSLLFAATILLSSATRGLNQGYLVPSGKTSIDQQLLSTPLKICALTFDDGPDARYTMQVHDILRRENIRASFFVIGRNVDRYPEQVLALAEYGHEICNHSYNHRDMLKLSKADINKEMHDTSAILAKLGITAHWFRPPYGSFNRTVIDLAADEGMDTMLWSVDPLDWKRPGVEVIKQRVLSSAAPGAVFLMHSTVSQTVEALPDIIAGLRKDGYTFVTVSEWQQLVSGSLTLDKLPGPDSFGVHLKLMDQTDGSLPPAGQGGLLSTGLSGSSDVWQRVPAGRPGSAERRLTVYANFVDDNDLRRVLSEGISYNMMQADSSVGNGLLRVLQGQPPQQIIAVVEQPPASHNNDSVEVQVIDAQVEQGADMLAIAAGDAASAAGMPDPVAEQSAPATHNVETADQPTIRQEQPAGPVALGSGSALSLNLASAEYAASLDPSNDDSIVFVSYASAPDSTEWNGLAMYMQLCGLSGFGYARGYSAGQAPADFPFAAGHDQEGRQRLELGMFNPVNYLSQQGAAMQWFIPLRSSDLARLTGDSLYSGVSNGFREFMLIRRFTAGLASSGPASVPGLEAEQYAAGFSGSGQDVLVIAAPRPGIELDLPEQYRDWQLLHVDGAGRLESRPAGAHVRAEGRLLILLRDSSD